MDDEEIYQFLYPRGDVPPESLSGIVNPGTQPIGFSNPTSTQIQDHFEPTELNHASEAPHIMGSWPDSYEDMNSLTNGNIFSPAPDNSSSQSPLFSGIGRTGEALGESMRINITTGNAMGYKSSVADKMKPSPFNLNSSMSEAFSPDQSQLSPSMENISLAPSQMFTSFSSSPDPTPPTSAVSLSVEFLAFFEYLRILYPSLQPSSTFSQITNLINKLEHMISVPDHERNKQILQWVQDKTFTSLLREPRSAGQTQVILQQLITVPQLEVWKGMDLLWKARQNGSLNMDHGSKDKRNTVIQVGIEKGEVVIGRCEKLRVSFVMSRYEFGLRGNAGRV